MEDNSIPILPVTDNTDVSDNTDNTDNTIECVTTVSSVLCDKAVAESIFGENTFEKILQLLATEKDDFTYDKIAIKLGKISDNIRQAINRKRDFFVLKMPNGKICHTYLSQMAIDEINSRIAKRQKEIEELKKLEKEKELGKDIENDVIQEFKSYFQLNKKSFKIKQNIVSIDFMDLALNNIFLSESLESKPEETIRLFETAIEEIGLIKNVRVRIYNLPSNIKINVEQIRANHINELISLSGRVVTLSDVRPQVVNAKFECPSCGTMMSVLQIEKKFREPPRCSCGRRGGFKLISKEMVDTARLILEDLQEKTDNPHAKRLNCFLKEDLLSMDKMKLYEPGTEVDLVGILKEVPVALNSGGISTRFEVALEVLSVSQMEEEIQVDKFTDEEIEMINKLSKEIDEKGLEVLTSSFAPDIYGHDTIKKAIILQLASKRNEVGKVFRKNKMNLLLIGDPGTSKSKLGEFAVSITPGARRSVGGSASAVGLTGAVVRDDYTGGWRLEPGAAALARDFYMVDELNNIKDEDKPRLQELLSEHTITIDKATVHAKLKALAGVLATANPIHGLFNDNEDLVKQFNLTPPIINRFDLIFAVRDIVDEAKDVMIARKMNQREMNNIKAEYDEDFLKKFFVYIKEQDNPKISEKMSDKISSIYSKLRKSKTESLNINPRVHAALLQLCKASAKIRLSEEVEEKDIERALDILSQSYFKTPSYKSFKEEF